MEEPMQLVMHNFKMQYKEKAFDIANEKNGFAVLNDGTAVLVLHDVSKIDNVLIFDKDKNAYMYKFYGEV